jgi:Ring finger domain
MAKLSKLAGFYILQGLVYFYVLHRYIMGEGGFFQEIVVFELGSMLFYIALHGFKFLISYFDFITLATESSGKNTRLFLFWDVTVHLLRMCFQLYSLVKFTVYYNYPVFWARDIFVSLITSFEFVRKFWMSWKYVSQINKLQTEDIRDRGEECGICLQKMEIGTLLSCSHYFHRDCLINWIHQPNVSKNCPVCRAVIKFGQPKKDTKLQNFLIHRRAYALIAANDRNRIGPEAANLADDQEVDQRELGQNPDNEDDIVHQNVPTAHQRVSQYLLKALNSSKTIDELQGMFREKLEQALPYNTDMSTINMDEIMVRPLSSKVSPDLHIQRSLLDLFSKEDTAPIGCPSAVGGINMSSLADSLNSQRFEILIEGLKLFYFRRKLKQTKIQSMMDILSNRLTPPANLG